MIQGLKEKDREKMCKNMINLLENFTLKRYPNVVCTKENMQELLGEENVLMSGSGPTVFGLADSREQAQQVCEHMKTYNKESYWTRTTF
jgi:4-diphosphocytidyl-2-C-methyl-D-erythritol kinase